MTDKKLISAIERKSSNTPVQGLGDMTKKAGVMLRRWIIDNGYRNDIQNCLESS